MYVYIYRYIYSNPSQKKHMFFSKALINLFQGILGGKAGQTIEIKFKVNGHELMFAKKTVKANLEVYYCWWFRIAGSKLQTGYPC